MNTLNTFADLIEKNGITNQNKSLPYTIGHALYIPLLYAYDTNNKQLKESFDKIFTLNAIQLVKKTDLLNDLNKIVFYYISSEYLRKSGLKTEDKKKIFILLKKEVLNYWYIKEGKVWPAEKFNTVGMYSRLNNILQGKNNGNMSYYNAVTDDELYIMATAVSLSIIENNELREKSLELHEICNTFYDVFKRLVVFNKDNTWFLQPNVWKDHPDYKDIKLTKSQTVNWDVSHFSRVPGFLHVLGVYFNNDISRKKYINKLKRGLSKLFVTKVAKYNVNGDYYKFANFIDGNDSSFRVGYRTGFKGYKSGENITNVFWAWWKLLETKEIFKMYDRINNNFNFYQSFNSDINRFQGLYKEICLLR